MKLVLATENPHKLTEIQHILPTKLSNGKELTYESMKSYLLTLPPETGTTLAQNATLKAVYVARATGQLAISDDTGLEVDFLHGAPGIYTARYGGEHGNAEANNQKLLAELAGVPFAKRTARFRTVVCLAWPDGKTQLFEGVVEGHIAESYAGQNGFGYDPIFVVQEAGKTFAQLTAAEKNSISHRGRALKKLADWLEKNLA